MKKSFAEVFEKSVHSEKLHVYSGSPSPDRTSDFREVFQRHPIVGILFTEQASERAAQFTQKLRQLHENICGVDAEQKQKTDSNYSSPAKIRKFFNAVSSKEKKKAKAAEQQRRNSPEREELGIIVVPLDRDPTALSRTLLETTGWWVLPSEAAILKTRLLRFFRMQTVPSLILLEGATRRVITTDGRRALINDPSGGSFPWWLPSTSDIFSGSLLKSASSPGENKGSETVAFSTLAGTVKGILFAASWYPPCPSFTRLLGNVYEKVRGRGHRFEILYCSSDRNEQSFASYFATMPWLAFHFEDERVKNLTRHYNVNGIPTLLILDENDKLISRHGRNAILADPEGQKFPWKPEPVVELTEFTVGRLKDDNSLVLFTDGSEEEVLFAQGILEVQKLDGARGMEDDQNGNSGTDREWDESVKLFYSGVDPVGDQILETLGLQEAPLPLICILDAFGDCFYVSDEPEVTEDNVASFISAYRRGKLTPQPFPLSRSKISGSPGHLGGIPLAAISAALSGSVIAKSTTGSPKEPNHHQNGTNGNGVTL